MKVVVATNETQGKRSNDFSHTTEGELVHFCFECDREEIDGDCGCRRSMAGLDSNKGTTTFKVAEMDITEEDLTEKIAKHYRDSWKVAQEEAQIYAHGEVTDLNRIARLFNVGVILEKRGDDILSRQTETVTV